MDNGFSKNILGFLEKAIFKEKVYHSGEKRSPGLMSCHFYSLYMLEQASGVFVSKGIPLASKVCSSFSIAKISTGFLFPRLGRPVLQQEFIMIEKKIR